MVEACVAVTVNVLFKFVMIVVGAQHQVQLLWSPEEIIFRTFALTDLHALNRRAVYAAMRLYDQG